MIILDLPDVILSQIFTYALGYHDIKDIISFALTSKAFYRATLDYVKSELIFISNSIRYLQSEWTEEKDCFRVYSRLFTPRIMIIGGTEDTRRCDFLFPSTKKSRKSCGLHLKRNEEFDGALHQGLVFVFSAADSASIGTVETYNPVSDTWSFFPNIPADLLSLSCLSTGEDLLLTGGFDRKSSSRVASIYRLRTPTDHNKSSTVSTTGSLDQAPWDLCSVSLRVGRSHHGSCFFQGSLWIAGGIFAGQISATNDVEVIDLGVGGLKGDSSSTPFPVTPMVKRRLRPRLFVLRGVLFAVGGDVGAGGSWEDSTVECWSAEERRWRVTTLYPLRRVKGAACTFRGGVFVVGGRGQGTSLSSWDLLDPVTNTWESSRFFPLGPAGSCHGGFSSLLEVEGRSKGITSALAVSLDYFTDRTIHG